MQIPQEILTYIEKQWKWDEDLKQDLIVDLLELPEDAQVNKSWCVTWYNRHKVNESVKQNNRKRLEEENVDAILAFCHPNSRSDDPMDLLIAHEEMDERFDGLSPLLYDTLEAIELEGRTPEEIAAENGESVEAVYKRAQRARKILQGNN